ncbi:3-oxoadipate enol-lactonase [Microvirga sp. KLBC 81]|uniref:bifunctional 3-oxoadipate enol-lactonase/4-carboxymuconolactone decarboxylase PcaDC n=1 Tax=Microvirga sp. KLBC 81 TaxID=1862707 RepID=UPI000D50962C|nr:3-oxoadipate enol-lactonase [Microvirga sp. KLBC 81]PVE20295.1 3-oxoadipate enol-lactonase [Microvirga sp. KLBC 81]
MPLLKVNGVEVFYELSGPTGAPVVVFSNSLGTTLAMWDWVVLALRGRYRVLSYDTRGHGRSQVVDAPITIDDLAADLVGLLDGLEITKAHVVGLSLGGMTGQALASRHPDRVASLTLMATAAYMPSQQSWDERASLVRSQGTAAIVEATMGRWFTPDYPAQAPERVSPVREAFISIEPAGYAVCCNAIGRMDLRSVIGQISAPTLVIAGADDPATPVPMAEEIRSMIPGAEMIVLSRAAHLLAVEQAEKVGAYLVSFLDQYRGWEGDGALGAVPFDVGLLNRKSVLGEEHVDRSLAKAGTFAQPWQDFITRTAWGEVWGDPRLPWKTRSLVTLAMMVALHREEEFKLHVRPALKNGVTAGELQSLLLQSAIYAGVPAANAAFRWVRDVLGEELA